MIPWADTAAGRFLNLNTSHPAFGTGKASSFAGFGPVGGSNPGPDENPSSSRGVLMGRSGSGPFVMPKAEWEQSGSITTISKNRNGDTGSPFTETISGGMSIQWVDGSWVIDDWREGTFQRPTVSEPGDWRLTGGGLVALRWSKHATTVSGGEGSIQRNATGVYQRYVDEDESMGPVAAENSGFHEARVVGDDVPQYRTLNGQRTWKGNLPLAWVGVRSLSTNFSYAVESSQDLGIRPSAPFNVYNEYMKPKMIRVILARRRNTVRTYSRRAQEEDPDTLNAFNSTTEPITNTNETTDSYQDVFSSAAAYYDFKGDVTNGDWTGIPFQLSTRSGGRIVQFTAPGLPDGHYNSRRCHVVRWRVKTLLTGEYRVRIRFVATGTTPPSPIEETVIVSEGMSDEITTTISPEQRHNNWTIESVENIDGQPVNRALFRFMFALRTGLPPQALSLDQSTLALTRLRTRSASYVSGASDVLPALRRDMTSIETRKRTMISRLNAFRDSSLSASNFYTLSVSNAFSFMGNGIHGGTVSFSSSHEPSAVPWGFVNSNVGGFALDAPDGSGEILETREILFSDSDLEWDGFRWFAKESARVVIPLPEDNSSWIRERVDIYAEKIG